MKFVKLVLKNFKPYYDYPRKTQEQEITLYDDKRSNKNITLNIGQTGHGKTSLSEAILWCIYGDTYPRKLHELINSMAVDIAKKNKENTVKMSVKLIIKINNESYQLLRKCTYNIEKAKSEGESELSIIHDGVPLSMSEADNFVNENFPSLKLMYYFVFDADDILKKFEENREGAIREHINKFAGVEKLDLMITQIEKVIGLFDQEIHDIESKIHGDIAEKIKEKETDISRKKEILERIEKKKNELQKEKSELFQGLPSEEVKKFSELVDKKDELEKEINQLNDEFYENCPVSNIDLVFLTNIINKSVNKLSKKQTTEEEFESSAELLKTSIENEFSGIFFNDNNLKLIKKGTNISNDCLENVDCLKLGKGEGLKNIILPAFIKYKDKSESQKAKFLSLKQKFESLQNDLVKVSSQLTRMGNTSQDREAKKKFDQYKKIEKQIDEQITRNQEINDAINDINSEINDLRNKLEADESQEHEIKTIKDKKNNTQKFLEIAKESRGKYLDNLLTQVNKLASEFLRETVKDKNRFHSIEIDSNYHFKVKQKNGSILEEGQINRGNVQLSMMSFFFGLSKFLAKEIPYIIDDPLLRLDPGHDKRLIQQLSTINEQIVFHVIPGKEYTSDSFGWLKPHINTQNWLYRGIYNAIAEVSHAEPKNPEKMIEYDIDKF